MQQPNTQSIYMVPRKITTESRLNIKGTQTLEPKVNREIALICSLAGENRKCIKFGCGKFPCRTEFNEGK